MTLRDRAREIKEAGEKERGNYAPEADSVPLRLYQYWARNNPHRVPKKENFCHYWRVVAFWSWWFWVRRTASNAAATRTFAALVAALYVAVAVGAWFIGGFQLLGFILALIPYLGIGLMAGFMLYDRDYEWWVIPAAVVTAPISLTVLGIGRLVDVWQESWGENLLRFVLLPVLVLGGVVMLVLLAMETGLVHFLIGVAILLGILVIAACFIMLAGFIGELIQGWRRTSKDKRREKWNALPVEDRERILNERDKPSAFWSAVGKFFRGVGDFLILLGQVIRVNKWKICPTVEIPRQKNDEQLNWD